MKGNSSSGYDESMKVVREPRGKRATETFFFRKKIRKGRYNEISGPGRIFWKNDCKYG